jgi:hypothetical protein
MSPALFQRDGDRFVPGELSRGPWSDDAQHGGAIAALLAGVGEAYPAPVPMRVTRVTTDLLRPVPLLPLTVEARIIRAGRSVDRVAVSAVVAESGVEVAVATLVRIRVAEVAIPLPPSPQPPPPPGPEDARRDLEPTGRISMISHAMELRWATGSWEDLGKATVWLRLRQPVVAGEAPTPLQRVAAAADFGNGVSSVADFTKLIYINPDLSIALHRHPQGEWVCLEARTRLEPDGMGTAVSSIYDERGHIGESAQTLLVDRIRGA